MAIIPTFLVTGLLAIVVSLLVLVWVAAFVQRKHGGPVLMLLSVVQLVVGGGFTSPFFGVVAGIARTKMNAPLIWWRAHLSAGGVRFLAKLWPGSLIAYLVWLASAWILGQFFNEFMLSLTPAVTAMTPGLLVLIVFTAIGHDIQRQADPHQAHSTSGLPGSKGASP
ncbi:MAG: hypothetical protein M5U01_38670 [Ardenticatenaceae bacterium]|nr:hypothetical protein [Ardenticatenaceae bacterium]HBY98479.1 hypothetical protein [Chloroflexota bacterium]